jgi:hypothetical protein
VVGAKAGEQRRVEKSRGPRRRPRLGSNEDGNAKEDVSALGGVGEAFVQRV